MYDWTKFDIHLLINSPRKDVFERWVCNWGLESFFVKQATTIDSQGQARNSRDAFKEGDQYKWDWFFNYQNTGKILKVIQDDCIEFTFGTCTVQVELKSFESSTLLHLRQSGIRSNEEDMVNVHLDCRCGWIYFLTNLKAVLEGNVDVRDKNPETSRSLEIGYVPPI